MPVAIRLIGLVIYHSPMSNSLNGSKFNNGAISKYNCSNKMTKHADSEWLQGYLVCSDFLTLKQKTKIKYKTFFC